MHNIIFFFVLFFPTNSLCRMFGTLNLREVCSCALLFSPCTDSMDISCIHNYCPRRKSIAFKVNTRESVVCKILQKFKDSLYFYTHDYLQFVHVNCHFKGRHTLVSYFSYQCTVTIWLRYILLFLISLIILHVMELCKMKIL